METIINYDFKLMKKLILFILLFYTCIFLSCKDISNEGLYEEPLAPYFKIELKENKKVLISWETQGREAYTVYRSENGGKFEIAADKVIGGAYEDDLSFLNKTTEFTYKVVLTGGNPDDYSVIRRQQTVTVVDELYENQYAPKIKLEFGDADESKKVIVSWNVAGDESYAIYRSEYGGEFKKIADEVIGGRYEDDLSGVNRTMEFIYRVVLSWGDVNDKQVEDKQQTIRFVPGLVGEKLMDEVQEMTLKYFTDFAHPLCGLARERSNIPGDLDVVTTGGTGFGIMAIIVGAERGFITRDAAYSQIRKITDFLMKVERFHGAYAHWYFGNTGAVKPFSPKDDGGDIVETSFLMQGLIVAYEYFKNGSDEEKKLASDIDDIWKGVEWNHYTKGDNKLYWHWSKNHDFAMNHSISGWNEGLMSYVMAASSPTYPITKDVYTYGYDNQWNMRNGRYYYGIQLPLGNDGEKGGPLFFAHYSFMGLDPHGLKDGFCDDYFEQNKAHVLINRAYCLDNPKGHKGYSVNLWGLTASDCPKAEWKYLAHAPGNNDNGTVSPTAALSSMPYAPEECMKVMEYLYNDLGDKMIGPYGFYDAINPGMEEDKQVYKSHLAIDQGPIVVMIENYRSGLIWKLFMQNEDVKRGLQTLGFTITE